MTEQLLVTGEELERFKEVMGRIRGPAVLSVLGKLNKELIPILCNELGREILEMDVNRIEELFVKIYQEKANEQELAEFRYLRDTRIPIIAKKIREYLRNIEVVKKTVNVR